jgi:hypothetical protein
MTLRVLGRKTSINVRKVLWTCAELDLRFEHVESDKKLLARNPNAMVPVIEDGDFVLWESNAICRYLAAKQPRATLLPADPQARARVEQWMDWQATELNSAWRYAFLGLARKSADHADPKTIAASVESWNQHRGCSMRILRQAGSSSPENSSRWPMSFSGYLPSDGCSRPWKSRISMRCMATTIACPCVRPSARRSIRPLREQRF